MLFDILGTLLAGLGLFFIGVKFIGSHLKQMTGRRFRALVTRTVDHPWRAGLAGTVAGALTQSTNAVTFIVISLITAGLMPVRKAMPVVSWANLGTSALVLVATVDIHLFVLYLLGLVGMSYYFNVDKSSRFRHLAGALLGIALLFLGLQFIKDGAAPLRELEIVREFLTLAANSYFLVFIIGAALTLVAQSSATVSVIAVAMTSVGLFTMNQTIMVIYGASLGSAMSIWFLTANLQGTARQLAFYQVLIKGSGVVVMVGLFMLEIGLDIPLVKWLASQLADDASTQAAWIYLLFQVAASTLLSLMQGPAYHLLQRLSPPTQEEELARPHFLYEQALDDAETALDLVEKEQLRLLRYLPRYLDTEQNQHDDGKLERKALFDANRGVAREVERFITDLMDRHQDRLSLHRMINIQGRNALIVNLQDSLYELSSLLGRMHGTAETGQLSHGLNEGLHAILLTLLDAVDNGDAEDWALLNRLTSDRTELMERIRHKLLREGQTLPYTTHEVLFGATSLFERIIWLLRRYILLVANGGGEPVEASN
ncbi:MAG: Na/Pi symporter [Ectothiorhodospiraceae bacterium]|jgi:phosphate:Na+ symporter|nr:Na/Pi symporter [Ectothiorhodospiraceae bacterium]